MNTSVIDSIRKTRLLKMTTETSMIDQICEIISRVKRKYLVRLCRSIEFDVITLESDNIGRIQAEENSARMSELLGEEYYWSWSYYYQRLGI